MACRSLTPSIICHGQSLETSRKPTPTAAAAAVCAASAGTVVSLSFLEKPHFNSLLCSSNEGHVRRPFGSFESGCVKRRGLRRSLSSFVTSAIATPNSVLSEEAFKKLGTGGFSESEIDVSEDEGGFVSEGGEAKSASEDELALSKLGLPQRLVESLGKRGITHLFPIQVCFVPFFLPLPCFIVNFRFGCELLLFIAG